LGSTVTTTLLFTDLVESTSLAARLGPALTDALRQVHFGLLRDALVAVNGTEVKNLGDGLMVAFTSSTRAVDCAVAMQQAIERHNRRAEEHLQIRIGISTGEAIEEDSDYFGTPVVEAARLCALARGGQILATDVVRAFVGMNASHTFLDMGALELKGLPAPVPTVEIAWESTAGRSLLPLPPRLAHQASNTRYGFCGRDIELTALVDAQKRAFNESCLHAMLVSGEAGIGKTTLIARATRDAHDNGVVVMFGRCDEELCIPYQPWIEALTPLAQHEDGALIRQLAPAHRSALARLLPSLIDASPTSGDRDSERLVLFEAVRSLLDTVTAESPLIVVLDDLHWADAASLHVLRYLVTASPAMPVLVVGTYRDTDLSRDHPLASLLANFHRESRTERLALSGLSETSVQALMVEAAGHELGSDGVALAHALRRETDGNPFFTEELLRHLGETGTVAQDATGRWSLRGQLEDVSLPSSVTEVVARRVAGLGDDVARALSTAAVVGREFDLNVLTRVVDLDEDALLDALEAATTAGVIVEAESVAGGYRFTHALFQHTLYRDVSAPRRQRLHRRIAEAFEEIDAGRHEHVAELAHHWLAATRPAELDKAME